MRIPQGLRSALASQTGGGGGGGSSPPTTDEYFGDVGVLLYGDGTNGSTAIVDSSSNGHTVNVNGNAQISTTESKFGGSSMYFNGSGDYLTIPSDTSFDFGTGDFTIEFWMNPTYPNSTWQAIISRNYNTTNGWRLYKIMSSNNFAFYQSGGSHINTTNVTLTAGTWYHIAVVRSGTTITIYVDGVAKGSGASTTNLSPTADLEIGQGVVTSAYPYWGYLDDLRITKGVARYTSNFTPPTASFSTLTPGEKYFYQNSLLLSADGSNGSTAIVDSSANAHTITANGNAQISTTQSKFGGSSMYFDGNGDYLDIADNDDFELGSSDFTLEAWVYLTGYSASYSGYYSAIILAKDASGGRSLNFGINGTSSSWTSLSVTTFQSSSPVVLTGQSGSFNFALNTWYHVAAVKNNGTVRLYVNGTDIGGGTLGAAAATSTVLTVGAESPSYQSTGYGYFFPGYIDDLRITKGVARYTSDFTIPTSEASSSDPYFSSTKLLLNGNGTNGSTDFVDSTVNFGNNYANATRQAVNGEIPNGSTAYWVDILPSNASVNYHSLDFDRVHNSDVTQGVYWVGSQYNSGNVTQARFDLRNFQTVTSVRIYAEQPYIGSSYHPYEARLLDSNKNVISNTTLVINNSTLQWLTVPVAGSPAFLELYAPTNPGARLYLNGIEVNGQHLVSKPITVNGDAQISTAQSKFGGASMKFDGNDSIEVPSSTDLSFGSGDFTIECWAYFNSLPSSMTVANFDGGGSYTSIFFAHLPSLNCYISGNGTSWNVLAGNSLGTPSTGVWHHLALVREGNVYRGFLDGVQGFSVINSSGPYGSSALARIGNASATLSQGIDGYIEDFRVTKGVARYGSFAVPTAGFSTLTPVEPYFHNNSLLLHGDGTNGSTTFTDSSVNNFTVTPYGNAQISTTQSKFGGASMYFDSVDDRLTLPSDSKFAFGTGDFTIEMWKYSEDISGSSQRGLLQISSTAGGLETGLASTPGVAFYYGSAGILRVVAGGVTVTCSISLQQNTWYHVAYTRSGNVHRLFIDGIQRGSTTTTAGNITAQNLVVGGVYSTGFLYKGYLDDLRITKGVARYTANFTPPTSALPSL